MKKIYLLTLLVLSGVFASAQVVDQFNYTGALNANGWTTHSGATPGQFTTLTTASDLGNSLSYAGLPASVGNRTTFVSANTEDVNKALTGINGKGYYSLLLKVTNTTGLTASTGAGDYFIGFATTSGPTGVSAFGGRLYIKAGATTGTFLLGVYNYNGGAAAFSTTELAVGTTYFVVVKMDATVATSVASLFVNPVPGAAEPTPVMTSNAGTTQFPAFGSLFLRQGTNTGNIQIDEIRAGSTWASVAPSGCATVNNMTVSNCGPYTLNSTTYTTSGTYQQVLPGANAAGCDSTINLTLTVKQPSVNNMTVSACNSYTLNSTTYTTSGNYQQVLPAANAVGCDSTINLNLTISTSITYYQDFDTDGFGNPAVSQPGCAPIPGYVTNSNDCDDNNNTIGVATVTYYQDFDTDGLGNPAVSMVACSTPPGYVLNDDDCNDANSAIGAATNWYPDVDGDGFGSASATPVVNCTAPANHVADHTDCNDASNTVYPGATEIPDNGIDEDCNGSDLNTLGTQLAQYTFTNNTCADPVRSVTAQPANAVFSDYVASDSVTCAAVANAINSTGWNTGTTINMAEYYSFTITPDDCYYLDLKKLTFLHRVSNSAGSPVIHIRSSLDSYNTDVFTIAIAPVNTDITENLTLPAAFDSITEAVTFRFYVTNIATSGSTYRHDNVSVTGFINAMPLFTFYADEDGDGFGDPAVSQTDCTTPEGFVPDNTDCDDTDEEEFPGAVWCQDNDTDGFGNPSVTMTQCTRPAGYVSNGDDCNDNDNTTTEGTAYYVDADTDGFGAYTETPLIACTPQPGYVTNPNDCDDDDNTIGIATTAWYVDADEDGFGESGSIGMIACTAPDGYVANDDDCDDDNDAVYPGATEICDGFDNNCNGSTDEGLTVSVWYEDEDGDSYGNAAVTIEDCTQPAGFVANDDDCDDEDEDVHPGAADIANNSIDENCDGVDGYLGVDENQLLSAVVFPNPGTDKLTIQLNTTEEVEVKLISADGKIVSTHTLTNGELTIETAQLQPGLYLVELANTATVRWIKK